MNTEDYQGNEDRDEDNSLIDDSDDHENDEPRERVRILVEKKQETMRIDKFLMIRLERATRNKIQNAIDEGMILVNNQQTKANYKIRPLDEIIVLDNRKPESYEVIPEYMPLNIAYEDQEVMVLNKPAGMVVHPACGNYHGTLINGVAYYLNQHSEHKELLPRVGLVHRIDKDTTGLIAVAKTDRSMAHLSAQFKAHTVHRRYTALVWGDLPNDKGTINVPIGRNLRFRKIMAAFPDGDHGKEAVTHYTVLERFNYVTLVELQLETGRTHQIRVHMMYIGHPLFNDETYGGNRIVKGTIFSRYKQFVDNCFSIIQRQSLHAKELGFTHPTSGERIMLTSDLPADLEAVIDKWRQYVNAYHKKVG
ncbi:MAG: RluA family pseudouridine synthase [Chitinophagia bacterium]|nr:RluA family pseudouridine synthase [Chitinophagia bacterium]